MSVTNKIEEYFKNDGNIDNDIDAKIKYYIKSLNQLPDDIKKIIITGKIPPNLLLGKTNVNKLLRDIKLNIGMTGGRKNSKRKKRKTSKRKLQKGGGNSTMLGDIFSSSESMLIYPFIILIGIIFCSFSSDEIDLSTYYGTGGLDPEPYISALPHTFDRYAETGPSTPSWVRAVNYYRIASPDDRQANYREEERERGYSVDGSTNWSGMSA